MRLPPTDSSPTVGASAQRASGAALSKHREPNATPGNGQTIRAAMADAHLEPSVCSVAQPLEDSVIGCEALYRSAKKCFKGVGRKYSAQAYQIGIIENTVKLANELKSGRYRPGQTHVVKITYPKPRTAVAISFRDRVYQRSLNDNALYPQVVKGFVYANCACQRGKGTHEALQMFKAMLRRAYLKYGTDDFYVLSCDVRHYYDTMSHETTNAMFDSCVDSWTAKRVKETLDKQYKGEFGYNPGSQMVQIAGIAYLNGLDHFIKEKLRTKLYVRYMDDFHLIGETERELSDKMDSISEELAKVGMELHPDKTVLRKATAGIGFLGYTFKVTKGGKVLMFRDRKRVKEIRRRMIRLTNKIRRGECARTALRDSYQCVRSCMEHGNSNRLLRRMDSFYRSLERSIQNG